MEWKHWARVTELAAAQHGLITTKQVLSAGAGARTLKRDVARGLLDPVRRGVYAVAGAPRSPWQQLMAACLAGGPEVVASHRSAAGLHGFPGVLPGAVELTVPEGRPPRLAGVLCHSSALEAGDVVAAAGFRATSPARTIVDMAGRTSPYLLSKFVDHCLQRRLCTSNDLRQRLEQLGGRGRPGTARLRRVLVDRTGGDSGLEATWMRILSRAGLAPPAVQHQVVTGSRVLLLDFAWPEQRVGVEVDGWEPHRHRSAWDHDHDKINAYLEVGWQVLFVTSNTPPRDVIRQLRSLISRERATCWPPSAT